MSILESGSSLQAQKIDNINNILIELAAGNFDIDIEPSDDKDDLDAVLAGVNMLKEELFHSTVSKEYLSSIYKGIVDMLVILSPDFKIQTVNQVVIDTLGFYEKELIGEPFLKLVGENDIENIIGYNEELSASSNVKNIELTFCTKDGVNFPVSYSASILRDKFGIENGYLFIIKDITKIKETENLLIEKNKELDTFVYKSSHDLKGPLASIIGLTNIAQMEVQDEIALRYFELIRKSAVRLDTILVNLSELARLRNSATHVNLVDMKKITFDIIDNFYIDTNLKKVITFKTDIEDIGDFHSNDKIIFSIMQNLIDNAVKYRKINVGVSSYIHIIIKNIEAGIKIIIKDNGLGIRSDKVKKVFDMFERANESSQGTGLGLYIVKTSIDKLKGRVQLKSVEKEGSTFTVFLPNLRLETPYAS